MPVEQIELELIDDNPSNPRKHYPREKVKEMAQSLREVGLRQVPEGRYVDGRVQLAYGHMRKRGYLHNQKNDGDSWKAMPVDVKEITDPDMFHFSMEENLTRTDITPIEVARCIENFSQMFPDVLDEEIAKKHNMTAANVSNMKRVLRLPEKILEKIDSGVINFTQGRELLTLEGLENAENLMASALGNLRFGNKQYGHANTVEGLQVSIHEVISRQFRPLDKKWEGYRWDLLFDTRDVGCLKCDKMLRTHPTKSETAHYCLDGECWDRHQEEHREKAAAEAKAKMQAEVINRASQVIVQEEKAPIPVMIDENTICVDQETFAKLEASNSCDRISEGTAVRKPVEFECKFYLATGSGMGKVEAYQLVPWEEFTGEVRTYRVPAGREYEEYYESLRNDSNGFYHGMLVKRGKEDHVLVGPEVTFATKVDKGDISQEMLSGQVEAADEKLPCDTCAKGNTCDRTFFHVADDGSGRLVCDVWECDHVSWAVPPEQREAIPEEVLAQAKEAAGTRAEVLDVHPLYSNDWRRELKNGYVLLNDVLNQLDNPQECLERCTKGFHYAFDSGHPDRRQLAVCTDPKCVAKKKAALTRKRNAEGQARKKAELKAVKEAVAATTTLDRPRMKLILLTQLEGIHVRDYYYGGTEAKKPSKWLWDKVNSGKPENDRSREKLFKTIDKLTDEDLTKLVVEFMFYYLTDKGDIGTYEVKTEAPLGWLGVKIEFPQETTVVEEGVSSGRS